MSVIRHQCASPVGTLPKVTQPPVVTDSLELLFSSEPDRQQAVTRVYLALVQNPGRPGSGSWTAGSTPVGRVRPGDAPAARPRRRPRGRDGRGASTGCRAPQAATQLERQGASLRALARR